MVNIKVIAFVLLVLPAIYAASSSCTVSVTQTLTESGRYNTYSAVATNTGTSTVTNIVLDPSVTLKTLTGLTASDDTYTIASLAPKASTSFTFKVKSGNTVKWTNKCSGSSKATTAPSSPSTAAPQKASTAAPQGTTPKATTAPAKATTAPAQATTAPNQKGGKLCPAGSWWAPAPLTTWQWQLTGTVDTSKNVQMYDIDLFDATPALINTLHSQGKAVICYFSTQYENWRSDASQFPASVRGNKLDGWAGENYVDIRSTTVRNIMVARLQMAVDKGCDGVEPDNVDGYTASNGFSLTAQDQISFNTFIANQAHAKGLSVGLKNDLDQAAALQPVFDWALNEQCYQYKECDSLVPFINAGKAVFNTEYSGVGTTVCPALNKLKFSGLIKGLDLDASIKAQCCTYSNPSCAPAAYTCKTSSSKRSVDGTEEVVVEEVTNANDNNNNEFTNQNFAASASTTCASVLLVAAVVMAALNF